MVEDRLRYDRMVERALRGVVREALTQAAEGGLPGNHHFYLTFTTDNPDVDIPSSLKEQYPEEMTIVLQHQFFGLEIDTAGFAVTLSFNNKHERLVIPFAAITTFADPSVNFALQFQRIPGAEDPSPPLPAQDHLEAPETAETEDGQSKEEDGSKIVTLDNFRKK